MGVNTCKLIEDIEKLQMAFPNAKMSEEMFNNIKSSEVMLFYRYVQLLELKDMRRDARLNREAPDGKDWQSLMNEKIAECKSGEKLLGLVSSDNNFQNVVKRNMLLIEETLGFPPREDFFKKYDEEVERIINVAIGRNQEAGSEMEESVVEYGNVELARIYNQGETELRKDVENTAKTPLTNLQEQEVTMHVDQVNHNLYELIRNGMLPKIAINGQLDANVRRILNEVEKINENDSLEDSSRKYALTSELIHVVENLSVVIDTEAEKGNFSMEGMIDREDATNNLTAGGFFQTQIVTPNEEVINDAIAGMENPTLVKQSFETAEEFVTDYSELGLRSAKEIIDEQNFEQGKLKEMEELVDSALTKGQKILNNGESLSDAQIDEVHVILAEVREINYDASDVDEKIKTLMGYIAKLEEIANDADIELPQDDEYEVSGEQPDY